MTKKFDVTRHVLVPKHEIMSKEEVKALLKRYGIRKEDLPWIRLTDPVVKAIGAKRGDVIRIIRESPTAGKTVYYRVVVG